jgi:hypothetical protein
MNIFASNQDPIFAAFNLDDKRLGKMILETAQLLSTAVSLHGGKAPYRSTHVKHPATIWASRTKANFDWLLSHGIALGNEFHHRFGKYHKSSEVIQSIEQQNLRNYIPDGDLEMFANCTVNKDKGISFKHIQDPVLAYQSYLSARWITDKRVPKWTNRQAPVWYKEKV